MKGIMMGGYATPLVVKAVEPFTRCRVNPLFTLKMTLKKVRKHVRSPSKQYVTEGGKEAKAGAGRKVAVVTSCCYHADHSGTDSACRW